MSVKRAAFVVVAIVVYFGTLGMMAVLGFVAAALLTSETELQDVTEFAIRGVAALCGAILAHVGIGSLLSDWEHKIFH